jgi:hypothetical protein
MSLVVSAPCVVSGQNPAPASPPAPRHEAGPMPAERRVEVRSMIVGQDGMRPMMMRDGGMHGMSMDVASMFLAHTGDLQLSDAQVTRLAAIARRSEGREKAMHARMDSAMKAMGERSEMSRDGNGAPRAMMMMRMPMPSEADRKAQHEDDREAFSVPTPDQLATAWEMMRGHHER